MRPSHTTLAQLLGLGCLDAPRPYMSPWEAESGLPSILNTAQTISSHFLMPSAAIPSLIRSVLLGRRGVLSVSGTGPGDPERARALALELAELGHVPSARLQTRLDRSSTAELTELHAWVLPALAERAGSNVKHVPLFRSFPDGIPADTTELWWRKVLVQFLQCDGQPCLFCGKVGTTHVLSPCRHVVCDRCFDGSSYSACPVCECHVDRDSPFFKPSAPRAKPEERVRFKLLDLSEDLSVEAAALFRDLCRRTQALSPDDRQALTTIVSELGLGVLPLIPETIPVRENTAAIFGTLLSTCDPEQVLPVARRHLTTATDVLRLIAVHSGTDGALLAETIFKKREQVSQPGRFWGNIAKMLGVELGARRQLVSVPIQVHRFKVAKLPRRVRRALLALLDGLPGDRLAEDMLRHRSYWVWVGEFLHPHEYASRFPTMARAFQIVRGKALDGTPAPAFQTWHATVESHVVSGNLAALIKVLLERPGEFARRLDHLLRLAAGDPGSLDLVATSFIGRMPRLPTPLLITLRSHLPKRIKRADLRVYWPKVAVGRGVFGTDERPVLPQAIVDRVVEAITAELLRRFAAKPAFGTAIIDQELREVILPFNERTASPAAIQLPRGSTVPVKLGKVMRLFLHWCQPETGGHRTDLDLSVAFYDAQWRYVGVCSYYQHRATAADGRLMAQSAGDLQDGPWPDGATEFVDIHGDVARAAGVRYVVAVVNNYAGMPFAQLARGFAGLMMRDDPNGSHFDPRTVELKFALQGANGIFMPLVLDLEASHIHWLDVYGRGGFEMNNVETSKKAICTICPGLMGYFASGVRASIFDVGLLHAAARCQRVTVRGTVTRTTVRQDGEGAGSFYRRIVDGAPDESLSGPPLLVYGPALALLFRGDVDLPDGSAVYSLFHERTRRTMEASDLLA